MSEKRNPRIGPLKKPGDIRTEMARVYRLGRQGEIETQDMGRFIQALNVIVGVIRDTDLEERLKKLEQANGNTGKKN